MTIETRFAHASGAPVPFRVDGNGAHGVLLISDWAAPYGEPGRTRFDVFVEALALRGARTITMLDGTVGPRGGAPDTASRIAAARAVAEAADLPRATVLGVADGAPVAAALAAEATDLVDRLVLFDSFPPGRRHQWGLDSELPAAVPAVSSGLGGLEAELLEADKAMNLVRGLWKEVRKEVADDPDAGRAVNSFLGGQGAWPRGIGGLLRNISHMEEAHPGRGGSSMLRTLDVPTLVLESRPPEAEAASQRESLGLEVAAQIPGSRHRTLAASSRWPWAVPGVEEALLEAESQPVSRVVPSALPEVGRGERILATVLFTDIVGSTERLSEVGDAAWRDLLGHHNEIVRTQLSRLGGREIDNAGDGFFAAFDIPARAVTCARAIRDDIKEMGLAIRAGLHTGEFERIEHNLLGIGVHIGARIAAQAGSHQILVSATVRDLVAGSGISFVEHGGLATLKGIPGEWRLFEVVA